MRALHALLRWCLIATMVAMVLGVGIGVISRYVLDHPLFWTDEIARFALIWMTFLGAAGLLRERDGHIRFDVALSRLPDRFRRTIETVNDVIIIAVLAVILLGGIWSIGVSGRHFSPALSLPMTWVYAVLPASAAVGIWIVAQRLVRAAMNHGR